MPFKKVITDERAIDELLSRSIDSVYPTKEALKKELMSGKEMRVYIGIDPTATYVHLGHSTNYIVLKRFWELGHKAVVLIGDFTAMIGDPSDKSAERVRLTKDEVKENLKSFKEQIGKILDFNSKENPIEIVFNSDWLSKLNFEDSVDLASNFTVQQMVERDIFEKRLKEKRPLYIHEFFYPFMQGYDSVALKADIEIGGTDQTFNMLAGRTLVKRYQNREKFVITTTLLTNPKTGEKLMSKSLGTGIALNEGPNEMYGKIMALPDEALVQCFTDCTYLSISEIEEIKQGLEGGANPKDIKMRLALEIVSIYHSKESALKAEEAFVKTFSKGETPENTPELEANQGDKLADKVIEAGLVSSKSEWRRLIEEGAVKEAESGEKIKDYSFTLEKSNVFRIGARRFIKIKIVGR